MMRKPDIGGGVMSKHSPDLPGWLGTARRNRSVEEPGRPGRSGKATGPQRPEGIHTRGNGHGRESERPIRAKKRVTPAEQRAYGKHCCWAWKTEIQAQLCNAF